MKKKSKGGKRPGAGRPPLSDAKENVSLRVAKSDINKWGGKPELKKKLYDFIVFPSQVDSISIVKFPIATPLPKGQKANTDPGLNDSIEFIKKTKDEPYDAPPLPKNTQDEVFPMRQIHNGEVLKQIEAIKAEKIPKERDTPFGRKAWQMDQQKRIQELQNKLK